MAEPRSALSRDGVRINYTIKGDAPARVALTHSLAMDRHFWDPVARILGDRASILLWDCRGHGRSDKPAGPYTAAGFADDLVAVLDDAGWDRVVAAGASMGGCVTLALGLDHPDRVAGLGLIDTTASYGADAPAAWEQRAAKARDDGLASMTAFQQTRWFSDRFRAEHGDVVDECIRTFQANDVDAYAETCRMLGRVDYVGRLGEIGVPTAIIVGEEDYAAPPDMARTLHEGIAGSTIEIIAGARHLTPLECPELIAERLLALAEKANP